MVHRCVLGPSVLMMLLHPLARILVDAQPDLLDAVRWVHSFGRNAVALADAREKRFSDLARWARMLSDVEERLAQLQSSTARAVRQQGCCISLVAACIKGLGLPDELFTAHQCSGFPCYGDYPDSGLFRVCERPAEENFDELDHEAQRIRVVDILTRQSRDPNQRHTLECVTEKTYKEKDVQEVAEGPFLTPAEVSDRLHTTQWRVLHRFGVCQGLRFNVETLLKQFVSTPLSGDVETFQHHSQEVLKHSNTPGV